MIATMIRRVMCRVNGSHCHNDQPSSGQILEEMTTRSRKVEAESDDLRRQRIEIRRQRHAIEAAFRDNPEVRHG